MGHGWSEWPLMIFTVLGQCVAGAFILLAMGWLRSQDQPQRERIVRSMFLLWVLMGLAFVASVLHLGSPLRAFNSLNRIGHSALSNEIASGSLFFAAGGLWWLVVILKRMPVALAKPWALLTMLLGILFVWMMARVYNSIDTVPTWFGSHTTLGFFLTLLLGGPLLGTLLLRLADAPQDSRIPAMVSALALLVAVAAMLLQGQQLGTIHSSVQQASALVPDYAELQLGRLVLLLLGLGCWLCPLLRQHSPRVGSLLLGFVLVFAGELIGRGIFYGVHMTVGMAVAS